MYTEGQTLKLTATETNPMRKIFTAPITVTVIDVHDNILYVRLSTEDTAKNPRKRDQISFPFEPLNPGMPGFYPDWTIEVMDVPIVKIEAPVPQKSTGPMSRESWNSIKRAYDVNVPEDSYEEYLANYQSASKPTFAVRVPDTGWERTSKTETTAVAETKLDDGRIVVVNILDDEEIKDSYVIEQAMIVDGSSNQILEYLDWSQIKLIGYDGSERRTTFSDLWGVMTAAEAAKSFGLAESTVRQAINRGTIPARKSNEIWLVRRKDAESRWTKKYDSTTPGGKS